MGVKLSQIQVDANRQAVDDARVRQRGVKEEVGGGVVGRGRAQTEQVSVQRGTEGRGKIMSVLVQRG